MLIEDYYLLFRFTIMNKTIDKISNQSQLIKKNQVNQNLSFCGIMKVHNFEIIQKIESEMPSLFQEYSDLYTRYLHSIKDIFGTCDLAENKYFEKMEVDQNFLKALDSFFISGTGLLKSQIDMATNFVRSYIEFRLSLFDSWDKFAHICVNMYAKSLSQNIQGTGSHKTEK